MYVKLKDHETTSSSHFGPDGSAHPTSADLAGTRHHRAQRPRGTEAHSCGGDRFFLESLGPTKVHLRLWMEEILHQKKLRGFFMFYPGIYGTINMFQPRCRISSSVLLHHIRPLLNRQHRQLRARRVAELGGFCWLSLWNPCASACSVEVLPWIVLQLLENLKVGPSQKGYSQGTSDYFCCET